MKDLPICNNPFCRNEIRHIVILGHTGFIGSRLTAFFRQQFPELRISGRSYPEFDLTKKDHASTLSELFDLNTGVIMCAAIKRQIGDSVDIFAQNLSMITNLCSVINNYPVRRLVYFSSAAVYGEDIHNDSIIEDTVIFPTSYYGVAKYASECLLRMVLSSRIPDALLILRPPLIYGPNDPSGTYGPAGFVKAALHREKITLWGDGNEQREFIFIEDMVKIVCRLFFHPYSGVVNIASGRSYTFKDVLDIITRIAPNVLHVDSRQRTKQKVDNGFNNMRLKELMPDLIFTDIEEGIKQTYEAGYKGYQDINETDKRIPPF